MGWIVRDGSEGVIRECDPRTAAEDAKRLRDGICALIRDCEADIQRYERSLRIGAVPAVAFETRITNTIGHLSRLRALLGPDHD